MRKTLLVVCSLVVATTASAQDADSVALNRRAAQIAAIIGGAQVRTDTIFNASFLAQVPEAQLRGLATQLAGLGHIQSVSMTARPAPGGSSPGSAVFELKTDKGYSIPTTVVIESAPPNLVSGLLFGAPTRPATSVEELSGAFRALPGHASLFVARVDGSTLVPIIAEDTARSLGIGSAFKLYVLAELTREIQAGRRHWADVARIDSSSKSLPSGVLQTWPTGMPVTIETLATLMISISDNTAADHLLHILGRENVEAVQAMAGNSHPSLNEPFLSTREMFVLKGTDHTALLRQYITDGTAERRKILADTQVTARQRRGPDFSKGPIAIDAVEWFATTPDMARVMVWLRDHSASGEASATRDVLTVNKGIDWPRATWQYVAFKGGSEPGVLNSTFLAQRKDGEWIAIVATWNDPAHDVDEARFVGLVTSVRDYMASH